MLDIAVLADDFPARFLVFNDLAVPRFAGRIYGRCHVNASIHDLVIDSEPIFVIFIVITVFMFIVILVDLGLGFWSWNKLFLNLYI